MKTKGTISLTPPGKILIQIGAGEVLQQADDDAADNGARHGIQPAEDHRRQNQQAQMADGNIDAVDVAEQGPAHAGAHEGDGPGGRVHEAGADPEGKGGGFVIGRRLHGKAPAGVLEKADKNDEQDDGQNEGPEIDRR